MWYVIDRVQDSYWKRPRLLIEQVVASCKDQVKPIEGREKLLAAAKEKIRAMLEEPGRKSGGAGAPGK